MLLEGKVAIVSGVGPGLGSAIATAFAREGAGLVVADAAPDALASCVAAIGESSAAPVASMPCDITDGEQCAAVAALAVERYGRIDVLVNDAYSGGDFSTFEHADLDNWRATADVNYIGTLRMCQAVLPQMKAQGGGRIVNINTQGVEWIQTLFGAYSASKAALQNATRVMASELGAYGIRVNGIHPGPIWSPGLEQHLANLAAERGVDPDVVYREWASQNALGYLVPPVDIADAVVLLASDLARAVTGQSLFVNAGHWFH